MEKITKKIKIANSVNHGWYQTTNKTVCYCQTPFNVAVILEQVSNYDNVLRDQVDMEKATCVRQNISEENIFK